MMRLFLTGYTQPSNDPVGESGFSFDTTNMINENGQGVIIVIGDSMGSGTTSIRPWQSGFDPQHPTPIDNSVYEFVYASGVVEITSEPTGSLQSPDIYPANTQSQWPQYGNEFFTKTGIKPILLRAAIGGAEFFRNGDANNWQPSPDGENYDFLMTAWEKCKTDAGVTKPLYFHIHCGINDAAASQPLSSIRLSIIALLDRIITDFGADIPIRFTGVGTSGGVSGYTRCIAVREFIENVIKNKNSEFVQMAVETYDYFGLGYYGSIPIDDGVHFRQSGNNAWGTDAVNHEITPFFDVNVPNDVFPKYSSLGSTSATFNFNCRVNFKLATTATVYWAVYPYDDANHTKVEIEAGIGAVTFGEKVTACNFIDQISITGLSNNTRYRIQMYAVIDTQESEVFRTISFRTRSSGNDPITDAVLARYSALDAGAITKITNFVEDSLDYDIWDGIDDVYWNAVNNTADKYISMKGIINPVNLGTDPEFVANSGLRTTTHAGTDRLNLQVNDFDFPNYLSNDGFYAVNIWEDTNQISSGTYRAAFGNTQSTNRQTRFGVTYNSSTNKQLTYNISSGNATIDFPMGTSSIEVNKLHIVSKVATQSTTLDANLMVDGDTRFVAASANNNVANTVDWYMFAQNNNGTISARFSGGINLLIGGSASLVGREYLTLACRELGIGV